MKKIALAGMMCSFALYGCGSDTGQHESILFADIDCPSAVSTIVEPGLKENVFNSGEEFNEYYYQLTGKSIDSLDSTFFEQHQIVAVEMGEGLTPSHRLDIIGVYDAGDTSIVNVQLQEPDTCPADGVERNPYCIIAVPKLNKPIMFNYTTIKKCNPGVDERTVE